ncbi:dihydroneopterin aldolase [Pseudidiomarina terrestris]|uniref:7,8-dihydroneopterin aldolase n=1 Tax=Pseudidiomarina terrestris TaxID=2820060 RepID=A0AAW7QZL6_9GAMM|nr:MULTISPECIES: dihydroneopterin aldolase [unclassified Pseudidiomarina]MDN7123805.1 dihydroneopterin aldolase [Pseudidiomarina sp. 1APP75-32.1]MDN7136228.1 dihydroneopterin aldolase [Pseudidiomarina sp. 1ASP75-5]
MDKVFVKGLRTDAYIGVYEWEHEQPQPLLFDLTMAWDQTAAAASDDLQHALDYDALSKAVIKLVEARPRQLIETVAEEVAELILTDFKVSRVTVCVSKPNAVPAADTVGVEITRGKN